MGVKLTNQVVLVVGASSGIGRETAILFAREGARVMAAARRKDRLRALQQELAAENAAIEIAVADASSVEDMEGLVKHTRERMGEIDILVYNSGTNVKDRALTRLTPATWDMMISVNLNGAFYATQAALPGMRQRGARAPDLRGVDFGPRAGCFGSVVPGFEARPARDGARRPRGGKGERHTHVRGLSRTGGYGDPGEPAGETLGGDARQGAAAGRRGGESFWPWRNCRRAWWCRNCKCCRPPYELDTVPAGAAAWLHAQDTRKVVEPHFPPRARY